MASLKYYDMRYTFRVTMSCDNAYIVSKIVPFAHSQQMLGKGSSLDIAPLTTLDSRAFYNLGNGS